MPINPQEIERYREILLDKRESLAGQVENLVKEAASSSAATETSKSPLEQGENAADTYEQDFAFITMESEEDLLRKIEQALLRIKEGTFGTCDECAKDIHPERLEALPSAALCKNCQELEERGVHSQAEGGYEVLGEFEESEKEEP